MTADSPSLLTVRDAAERLGVTPRTLKYYEERGLVSPTRSEGRYRLYDEEDLQRFGRILRLRSLGFSLHGISEMLKRPMEPVGGKQRFSTESLQQIHDAIAGQADALDARIRAMRRELKEAQKLRDQLSPDLEYLKRRLAGENPDALLEQRRNALAKSGKARKTVSAARSDKRGAKDKAKPTADFEAKRANKPRAAAPRPRS
ncbi:MerR family transcriptional regulator [Burkholderia sp. WSM2230]|uniref:MerR family transcriptional regulator n=1 Tax=Burkholderia sp. WSM2230 TaxID=944435 RepID=UPI0004280C3C|nr:MerR family transcriptional regulator [Burkholderia sp. WSM2230]